MPDSLGNPKPRIYRIYPAILAPLLLSVCALTVALAHTAWALLAIPFIYLGSVCAAPNLNLVNGCLAYVAGVMGLVVAYFDHAAGEAIILGTVSSYYLSAIEKWITAKPIP